MKRWNVKTPWLKYDGVGLFGTEDGLWLCNIINDLFEPYESNTIRLHVSSHADKDTVPIHLFYHHHYEELFWSQNKVVDVALSNIMLVGLEEWGIKHLRKLGLIGEKSKLLKVHVSLEYKR